MADERAGSRARVDDGNGGFGIIEITFCPFDLLEKLAAISGVAVMR